MQKFLILLAATSAFATPAFAETQAFYGGSWQTVDDCYVPLNINWGPYAASVDGDTVTNVEGCREVISGPNDSWQALPMECDVVIDCGYFASLCPDTATFTCDDDGWLCDYAPVPAPVSLR